MPRRPRRPRIGDYLITDDESGFVTTKSNTVRRWDGAIVRKAQNERRNPQEFVRALRDPAALRLVRPQQEISKYCPTPFHVIPTQPIGVWTVGTDCVTACFIKILTGVLQGREPALDGEILNGTIGKAKIGTDRIGIINNNPDAMEVGCTFYVWPDGLK